MVKNKNQDVTANREFKDTLFRFIFKEKAAALTLYNALNETNYTDENDLSIVTLESVLYLNVKNDLAFILDSSINLYEHQSTYTPNMPFRHLKYVVRKFNKLITDQSEYSRTPIELPYPKFVVFYNGKEKRPEREILKLSDLYTASDELKKSPELELKVLVLNINTGHNEELKKKCPLLMEYMVFVDKVRYYIDTKLMELYEAIECTINSCIKNGILKEFLIQHRAEVLEMSYLEYNYEEELEKLRISERKGGYNEGYDSGEAHGIELIIINTLSQGKTIDEIVSFCGLPRDLVESVYQKHQNRHNTF